MQKGDAAYIKKMNMKLVLNCIMENEPISRAEISKLVQISKPSVSLIVESLLDEGWVQETGPGQSTFGGGRKPVQLVFNPKAAYVIGVDIGGTKVASGITGLDGNVYAYREFETQSYLNDQLIKRLQEDVLFMMQELGISDQDVLGMGVGVPGVTNVKEGVVLEAPTLKWKQYPLQEIASNYFNFPIYIENDVNTSLLGEHWLGTSKNAENIIYIAIGTGIGSGIMINGRLFRGSNYSAGEMGYLVTDLQAAKSYNPTFEGYGFLESVASGSSIGNKLSEVKGEALTSKDAFELKSQGDEEASKVVDDAIEHLGFGIANYISLFDPDVVILGGGVSKSFSQFNQALSEIIERFSPESCEVVPSSFGNEAGVIGAVALFLKESDFIIQI
ncbi:ROK family protein [Pontibacillus yanchengensis]|uniref:ROK family protein n=2 Tax=Pontibacillus yanchengensis TaxID=462910 RepID=A0ACC7VGC2_9BACI|nr:ROK family transcriptional regulator [Pontibacillus yanchengensis]MYL34364.1 ROK family protein [Pontibacillus yanchengensis]MYL53832.1 ROK family protein [Pontibacillus yanchengensis]